MVMTAGEREACAEFQSDKELNSKSAPVLFFLNLTRKRGPVTNDKGILELMSDRRSGILSAVSSRGLEVSSRGLELHAAPLKIDR